MAYFINIKRPTTSKLHMDFTSNDEIDKKS